MRRGGRPGAFPSRRQTQPRRTLASSLCGWPAIAAGCLAVVVFASGIRAEGWAELFSDYLLTGQKPHPAVARVVAPDGSGTSLGSGVLVDINASQALVLTNWHVVRDSRSAVLVQFPDGFQSAGTVVRVDEVWDLAAIVIWKPAVEPVELAARPPAIGEILTIAGYGRGPYRAESGACTQYLSPAAGQPMELVELVAVARQGDSGGPIFNAAGQLAGVLFGQADGRTIGASGPRIRLFLASVGSGGYTASAAHPVPPPTTHGPSPLPVANPMPPPIASIAPTESALPPTETAEAAAPTQTPSLESLTAAVLSFDPMKHAQPLLAVVGAATMIIAGIRGIVALRRGE